MAVTSTDAVSSTTSTTTTYTNPWANATTSSDSSSATLNYNNFLQLLIAQIQNQDPTDPMDSSTQITQLATYSQVEQSIKTNTLLQSMLQADALTKAGDLVGKTVTSSDSETTGVVSAAKVSDDAITLTTADGDSISLQTGVTIKSSE
ncbi:flagellar hook assembly protein FlgD [Rhizobium sp.]|jgi:flagellar basal-body rod modification protein FlgD|uniref:flagellar hook assembly protein FlgD n=1 Tax=Rhizobium sp. TaxID=391 RepID=UPI000E957E15|nr:flagellar biosynthesis protein FlgD [Rhizobium sp.]